MTFARLALLTAALAAGAGAARAQQPPGVQAEEPQAEWQRRFAEGLDALRLKDLAKAEAAFRRCVELDAGRAVNHYNLACVYAQANKPADAVRCLTAAFERGFTDLCHVGRDPDLDPVRDAPAFKAAVEAHARRVLDLCGAALTFVPEGVAAPPLLVWVHDQGADPVRDLATLKAALPGWALLVPQGVPARRGVQWDDRCEFVVTERLRALREAQGWQDPAVRGRTVVAGQGAAGALAVLVAAQHPDQVVGVLAAGPRLSAALDDAAPPKGLRAYLVVGRDAAEEVEAGVAARDVLVRAGAPVVLERAAQAAPLGPDPALLVRALGWLRGEKVTLPGAGVEQSF